MPDYVSTDPHYGAATPSYVSTDPNYGLTPQSTAAQPQSRSSYVSTDPNYGLVNPAIKQAGADAMSAPESFSDKALDYWEKVKALAATPSPEWMQPAEQRARTFVEHAGVPSSLEEVKQFVTRNPIQDVKDIYGDVAQIPARVRNIGQTLSTSPAATVIRDPLSKEAFGVYGTAAGMLLPGAHEAIRGARVAPEGVASAPEAPPARPEAETVPEPPKASETPPAPVERPVTIQREDGSTYGAVDTGKTWENGKPMIRRGNSDGMLGKGEQILEPQSVDESGQPVKLPPNEEAASTGTAPSAVASATDTENGRAVPTARPEQATVGESSGMAEPTEPATSREAGASQPVGVAEKYAEAELPGSVEPGEGKAWQDALNQGRDYLNQGGDPRLAIRRAKATGLVGAKEVGIVRAEYERLAAEKREAAEAADAQPDNPALQQQAFAAEEAQRSWRKEMQPVLTKASDSLRAIQGEAPSDLSTFSGLHDLVTETYGGDRVLSPEERTNLKQVASRVKDATDTASESASRVADAVVRKQGSRKIMSIDELTANLADTLKGAFRDCVL